MVLFINKIDLIEPMSGGIKKLIENEFEELTLRLRKKFISCRFSIILGAASKGLGICGMSPLNRDEVTLKELIYKEAVEIKK